MIDPPAKAFRRRANEMRKSASREFPNDLDSAALMMFYAAECALKHLYMLENGLKSSSESRGGRSSVTDYKHNLVRLIEELKIPRAALMPPVATIQRTSVRCEVKDLHQAWRYGEKVIDSADLYAWLDKVAEYCEQRI